MNSTTEIEAASKKQKTASPTPEADNSARWMAAVCLCLPALVYTVAVVLGYVPESRKIDIPNIILLVLAGACALFILRPNLLKRVTKFRMGDMEWELDSLKQRQEKQAQRLDAIDFLLPLFFRGNETKHLQQLAAKQTGDYEGSEDLKKELRNLAKVGLIVRISGRKIADIPDKQRADIADFVRLTDFGGQWVEKFNSIGGDNKNAADE
jgi:hypothetical protein